MKLKLNRGTTSKLLRIYVVQNASGVSPGMPLTGLAYNTSGLTWYYIYEGESSDTSVTMAAGTVGIYSSGSFVAVDATNMPGVYEISIPNAALATGNSVFMMLQGPSTMTPVVIEIELDAVNYQAATNFGLSALPTASPAASGGLPTIGTGSGQINPSSGNFTVAGYAASQSPDYYVLATAGGTAKLATDTSGRVILQPTQTGVTIPTVTTVTNAVTLPGSAPSWYTTPPTASAIASVILATPANLLATDSSGRVLLQPTQAGVTIPTVTTVTNLTNAPTAGDFTSTMKSSITTAATAATPTANLNLTQSIPTSNTAQTVGDALNAARAQGFGKWVLSGTTLTLYASDGATVVRTFTLDSATSPTQRS